MKLIYLANIGLPANWAHEIQIMKMCEAFGANGLEVELVVPRRSSNLKEDFFAHYGVKDNFKITQLFCLDLNPGSAGRFNFWIRLASFLIAARIYLSGKSYDILYTRERAAGLFFEDFALEVHSLPEKIKKSHRKIWQKAKFLIVLTSFIKKDLINCGIDEKKIVVAPDGVDLAEFDFNIPKAEAREKLGLPQGKRLVVYTGNFFNPQWKGADVLMESSKFFSPDYLFVLVGGEKQEIERAQKEFGGKNLVLIERQPHMQIPYYLKAADVLVLPNKKGDANSEKYTSPLKLFEYMASGRPVVASDLPSMREVLNENSAVLVEPDNPSALAQGIKRILDDQDLGSRFSQEAFANVKNYTWQKRAAEVMEFIK
ncbi:MAG: glycosyltransferase family 4 protein [bacterium]